MRIRDLSSDVCASDLGGVQRVELGIEVVEPELDRSRVADLLVDPRLVEPQRADAGFDIADRLDVAGEIADRPTVVIEAVDMELGAGPARDLFELGLEHEVEVVEIARAAPPPACDIAYHYDGIGDLAEQGAVRLLDPRAEESRVGKECVRTCRSRWSPSHENKKRRT